MYGSIFQEEKHTWNDRKISLTLLTKASYKAHVRQFPYYRSLSPHVALLISILLWSMRCIKIPMTSGGIWALEFEHLLSAPIVHYIYIYIYITDGIIYSFLLMEFKILCTTIILLKTIIIAKVPRYHNWVVCFSNVPVKMGVKETFRSIDICINYIFHSI